MIENRIYYTGSRLWGAHRKNSDIDCFFLTDIPIENEKQYRIFSLGNLMVDFSIRNQTEKEKKEGINFFFKKYVFPIFDSVEKKIINLDRNSYFDFTRIKRPEKFEDKDYMKKMDIFFKNPKTSPWFDRNWETVHSYALKQLESIDLKDIPPPNKEYKFRFRNEIWEK